MTRRWGSIVVSLMTLACCAVSLAHEVPGPGDVDKLLKLFPGYHLLSLQERDNDTKAFFTQNFPKANPSLVRGDFDGDGHDDYAALLKEDKSPATKLVVLLCQGNGECKRVYEQDETAVSKFVYLRPLHPGSRVSEAEGGGASGVKLAFTGIQVAYFEKGAVVLYWNSKLRKIEEIQSED